MLLVAILAAIGAGSYFAAIVILTINIVALLSYFAARWTRRHYAVLTPDSLRVKFGFGPPVVIPYDIISGVNTRPAGFFASQYVLLKLRRWRWQLLFPLPLLVPSRRFNVPVACPRASFTSESARHRDVARVAAPAAPGCSSPLAWPRGRPARGCSPRSA